LPSVDPMEPCANSLPVVCPIAKRTRARFGVRSGHCRRDTRSEHTAFALIYEAFFGAGDGIRTHDPNLGKVVLYLPTRPRVAHRAVGATSLYGGFFHEAKRQFDEATSPLGTTDDAERARRFNGGSRAAAHILRAMAAQATSDFDPAKPSAPTTP
jgi:hypothetical protein